MVMPDFADVPTGWVTDRYQPHSFANVGSYQGKSDVLGIEINRAEGLGSRASGQNTTFYNTQGMQHALSGAGAGSILAASLYIESGWTNSTNGNVRTDMWGVVSDPAITDYPIIGFTNYGGLARYRVWDGDTTNGWVDLPVAVSEGAWVDFAMELTADSIVYSINGNAVYTDNTIGAGIAPEFSAVIMQAYNFFGDTSIDGSNPVDYVAHWANLQADIPEPGSVLLLGIALVVGQRRLARRK